MKRVLIVKLWALGDILMATPLLAALHQHDPEIKITWLADAQHADILKNHPLIEELIAFDSGQWRRLLRKGCLWQWVSKALSLRGKIRHEQFDAVINCHPEKWWTLIFCVAPVTIGLYPSAKMPVSSRLYTQALSQKKGRHNSNDYLEAARLLGLSDPFNRHMFLPVTVDSQSQASEFLQTESAYRKDRPLILLHPGTSQPSKCWPTDHYAAVAAALSPEYNVIITGSPRELPLASAILAALPPDISKPLVAIGKLSSIGATAALVRSASAVVTGDTALLHIASALETPLVGIFGSTRPGDNRPLYGPQVLLYDDSVSCAPCYQGHCPLKGSQKLQCQKAVMPEHVLSALYKLLAAVPVAKENRL